MDWRKVRVIARHEYVTNIRRVGFIIMTAIVPVLGVATLVIGALFAGQARQVGELLTRRFEVGDRPIGVVDGSGFFSAIMPAYQEDFIRYESEASAMDDLKAEELSNVLMIGEDYVDTGRVVSLSVGSAFGAVALSDSSRVRAFLVDHLLAGQVDPALQQRAAYPVHLEPKVISKGGETKGEGPWGFVFTFVVPYLLSVFLVMTIFTSSGYLMQSVAEEKESRVIEIVVSSVQPISLMAGKVIGLGALGLTQVVVWLLSAGGFGIGAVTLMAATGATAIPTRVLVLGVVYYVLGFTLYAILMAGIGALGTTMRESQQLAGVFSFFAAVPYMLSGFLFATPNAVLPRVLSYFPLTAPTMMMLRLPLAEVPWIDVAGSIVLLTLAIPVALWLGAKLFQVGLLVYGKRPTAREIWIILRGGE